MADVSFLSWPFFTDAHRALARDFDAWCEREIVPLEGQEDEDLDGTCREIVRRLGAATKVARELAEGPSFAHGMTKTMLSQEWSMTIDQAIEAEAQAQAICMQTEDFARAYRAFAAKEKPVFEGD